MTAESIRVLLADDHTLVRSGIRALLETLPDVEVVAEAAEGHDALRLVALHRPDIVFVDVNMPRLNGLEVLDRITRRWPEIRVIILSMYTNEEYVLRALQQGAAGYLHKNAALSELRLAVQAMRAGDVYLSPSVSRHVTDYVRRTGGSDTAAGQLTSRQREILQLIAEGRTSREIAAALGISAKTVETHRRDIMDRLDIHDIAGLVRFAIRTGLASLDD